MMAPPIPSPDLQADPSSSAIQIETWLTGISVLQSSTPLKELQKSEEYNSHTRLLKRRRTTLGKLSANTMTNPQLSTSKRKLPDEFTVGVEESGSVDNDVEDDVNDTPRPSRWHGDFTMDASLRPSQPELSSTSQAAVFSPASPRPASQNASDTTKSSKASSRSRSPTKNMASLARSHSRIQLKPLEDWDALPPEIDKLATKIDLLARGFGTVSPSLRNQVEVALKYRRNADSIIKAMTSHTGREDLGITPSPSEFEPILRRARILLNKRHSEAAWKCEVHYPLLRLALSGSSCFSQLDTAVVTSARVGPATLLPIDFAGEKMKSKLVDFTVMLEFEEKIDEAISYCAGDRDTAIDSLGQTYYEPLRYSPVAISIETKIQGDDWDRGHVQLSVWVAAQFEKLEQLVQRAGVTEYTLPVLPQIFIQGHDWYFLVARRRHLRLTEIWAEMKIGDTRSIEGMYSIVATLHYLMSEAVGVFKPWFAHNIVKPLLLDPLDMATTATSR